VRRAAGERRFPILQRCDVQHRFRPQLLQGVRQTHPAVVCLPPIEGLFADPVPGGRPPASSRRSSAHPVRR
jgi:hypothetical protein